MVDQQHRRELIGAPARSEQNGCGREPRERQERRGADRALDRGADRSPRTDPVAIALRDPRRLLEPIGS
jgi:hypothetical protein